MRSAGIALGLGRDDEFSFGADFEWTGRQDVHCTMSIIKMITLPLDLAYTQYSFTTLWLCKCYYERVDRHARRPPEPTITPSSLFRTQFIKHTMIRTCPPHELDGKNTCSPGKRIVKQVYREAQKMVQF